MREREGLVLVEGPHAVSVARGTGASFRFAVMTDTAARDRDAEAEAAALGAAGIDVVPVDAKAFERLVDTESPRGILAVAEEPRPALDVIAKADDADERAPRVILVLDRVRDPGNVGTLVRAAVAFGAAAVVALDGTADPWSPKAVRASAGEAFRIPIARAEWNTFEGWRRARGLPLVVADGAGTDVRRFRVGGGARAGGTAGALALLIGNEGAGPRSEARASADAIIALPIGGGVESLNAAVAGSVLLWVLGPGRTAESGTSSSPSSS